MRVNLLMTKLAEDGLLTFPYTKNDWIILILAISGYLYRMYLTYKNKDAKNPEFIDWVGILFLTVISTIGFYELALHKKWNMGVFFLPFSISIILAKDVADWLFMSKDGKAFLIATVKELISGILKNFGYIRKEIPQENEEINTTD